MNNILFVIAIMSLIHPQDSVRNVGVLVIDHRDRPVEGIILHTESSSDTVIVTDFGGHAVLEGVTDSDTLFAVLPQSGVVTIPLDGRDSLKIKLKSGARYKIYRTKDDRTTPEDVLEDVPALLRTRNVTSLVDLLQGIIPGLNISRTISGEAVTTIRGVHSIYSSSEPLVLVDGVEVGTLSDADRFVNVYDIQSIAVDKDGSMYGNRGGNGVIKISTIGSGVKMY